jgi:hypothetical protein
VQLIVAIRIDTAISQQLERIGNNMFTCNGFKVALFARRRASGIINPRHLGQIRGTLHSKIRKYGNMAVC